MSVLHYFGIALGMLLTLLVAAAPTMLAVLEDRGTGSDLGRSVSPRNTQPSA